MKSIGNELTAHEKRWIERMIDFLLGPSPHPVYVMGAAAGFGSGHPQRTPRPPRPYIAGNEAHVALAAAGFASYSASDPSARSDGRS